MSNSNVTFGSSTNKIFALSGKKRNTYIYLLSLVLNPYLLSLAIRDTRTQNTKHLQKQQNSIETKPSITAATTTISKATATTITTMATIAIAITPKPTTITITIIIAITTIITKTTTQ